MYVGSKLLKTSHREGSWSRIGASASRDSCGSAPMRVQSDVIFGGSKKLSVSLSSSDAQPKYRNKGWHLPSTHDWAPGRNAMAVWISFWNREVGLGASPAPGDRTPWWNCRMLSGGSNIHPLSARFSTVQIVWKIHEAVKCERYKANPSVWSIWQGRCRSN